MDIYNTVYHFLAEAVLNAEESEEETNMEIQKGIKSNEEETT